MLEIPKTIFNLQDTDICQCGNEDKKSKDVLTWIDFFFKNENDRRLVMKALAVEAKVPSHTLLKWNDTANKADIAAIFNKTIAKLKRTNYNVD